MNRTSIQSTGATTGNLKSYATGLILAIILTTISFVLVIKGQNLSRWVVLCGIFSAAVLQMLVHLHYFLHLDRSSEGRWNVLALILTVSIMILFIGGTLWIMFDLNSRMM